MYGVGYGRAAFGASVSGRASAFLACPQSPHSNPFGTGDGLFGRVALPRSGSAKPTRWYGVTARPFRGYVETAP